MTLTLYIPLIIVVTGGVLSGMSVDLSSVVDGSSRTPDPFKACRELSVARKELATTADCVR